MLLPPVLLLSGSCGFADMVRYDTCPSPFGNLLIGWEGDMIVSLKLGGSDSKDSSPVSELAAAQLQEYFSGNRKCFTFPMELRGTPFQISVWEALSQIPYGETVTYKDIARAIGNEKAVRAVGMACNRNPIWIAIPCHRVVGANQKLTGYAGGISMKEALLKLECTTK